MTRKKTQADLLAFITARGARRMRRVEPARCWLRTTG